MHTSSGAGLQNLCAPAMESVLFGERVLICRQWLQNIAVPFRVTVPKAGLVDAHCPERRGFIDANNHVVYSNEPKDADSDFSGPFFEGPITDTSVLLFAAGCCGALFHGDR